MKIIFYRQHPPFLPPVGHGFSLVDVMMALAIASLGFVTMLGVMPHGLQLARSSAELSAESRIKQKLVGELLTASWEQLDWTGYGPTRYFNDQGIELTQKDVSGGIDGDMAVVYLASIEMPEEPLDFHLPAGGQPSPVQKYLRRVKICVATSSDPEFNFRSAPSRRVRTFTTILADAGQ